MVGVKDIDGVTVTPTELLRVGVTDGDVVTVMVGVGVGVEPEVHCVQPLG